MAVTYVESIKAPGRGPAGLAWDGYTLWNSDYKDGLIYGLDPESHEVKHTLRCHGNLSGLAWDGQSLWQSLYSEGMIRRIEPVTNDFEQHIILQDHGWLAGVAWGKDLLWVVAQQQGNLLGLIKATGTIQTSRPIPIVCGDLDYHGDAIWTSIATPMKFDPISGRFEPSTEDLEFAIIALDPASGREIARYPVDQFFTGLCWVGRDLWLAQSGKGLLYRVNLT